jgi:hypothetical protein
MTFGRFGVIRVIVFLAGRLRADAASSALDRPTRNAFLAIVVL